ncbi:hypothetical protein ACF08B_41185 [Streptomyces sp. NPDC015139]|uniref:hypothetical protein n=1 Tax=Streptomyces sp. NPDC015139 TaxID=3364942 RepID=UPI003700760C
MPVAHAAAPQNSKIPDRVKLSNAARQDYPAPDTPATRAARLAAQPRERARTAAASAPEAAPRTDAAAQQQARHAGVQSGVREGLGLRHA